MQSLCPTLSHSAFCWPCPWTWKQTPFSNHNTSTKCSWRISKILSKMCSHLTWRRNCRCSCFIWLWLEGFCLYMSNMLWRETEQEKGFIFWIYIYIYILYSFSMTLGLRFRAIYFVRLMYLSHGSLPSLTSIKQNGGFWTALDQTPVLWPENTPLTTHLYCFTVNKKVFRKWPEKALFLCNFKEIMLK